MTPQANEVPEVKTHIMRLHKNGNGYKNISKLLDISWYSSGKRYRKNYHQTYYQCPIKGVVEEKKDEKKKHFGKKKFIKKKK